MHASAHATNNWTRNKISRSCLPQVFAAVINLLLAVGILIIYLFALLMCKQIIFSILERSYPIIMHASAYATNWTHNKFSRSHLPQVFADVINLLLAVCNNIC